MTAVATLFIRQEDGTVNCDQFFESDSTTDPYHRAAALWQSIEDDFPGAVHAIHINEEARELMKNTRMKAMGFTVEELNS